MAGKKGDVTYEIRADDSRVESDIDQANKKVEKAAKKSADDIVKVEQDKTKKITAENDKVARDAEKTADDVADAWKDAGEDAEKAMSDIEVSDVTVDVDADTGKAETRIKSVSRDQNAEIDVDADVSDADEAIKDLGDTVDDTTEKAASAFGNLGNVISSSLGDAVNKIPLTGKIGELTQGLSGTQAVAIGAGVAAGGALIGIGGAAVSAATDIDSAMNQLQASTGITADQTERYRGVLEDIYKNGYGESFGDIGDALSQIRQQIGPVVDAWDPSALQSFTESAISLRDTFGYDITESVRAANTMMDQFCIDGEEAMDLIASGAQNGLDYSGELIDSINEYSVQFQKMGLDAYDMFAIFEAGSESGAFNLDKIGDAIKEMSIRVVDGSDTTVQGFELIGLNADEMASKFAQGGETAKEAFKETISALAQLEDPLAQNTAGVDLFGTMWEDLGPEAITALAGIEGSAYDTSDALENIKDVKYDDLGSQFDVLKRNVEMLLVPLGEQLIPILSEIMEDVIPPLIDALEPLLELVGELLEPLLEIISSVLEPLLDILSELLEPFLELIESCIDPLMEMVQSLLDPLLELMDTCIRPLLDLVLELIDPLLQLVSECLQPLLEVFTELFEPISNLIESALKPLLELLEPFVEFISAVLTPILWVLLEAFSAVFTTIVSVVLDKVGTLQGILDDLISFVQNIFAGNWSAAWQNVQSIFSGIMDLLPGYVQDIIGNIGDVLGSLIDFIQNIFAGNWSAAWQNILDILHGIWNGIVSVFKAPLNAIVDAWNTLVNSIGGIEVPDWVPVIGGNSFSLPKLPRLKVGMDYVPFDKFPAYLDEGEWVLTKEEAEMLRSIGGIGGLASMMTYSGRDGDIQVTVQGNDIDYDRLGESVYDAFQRHGMGISIDRREFGRIMEDILNERGLL